MFIVYPYPLWWLRWYILCLIIIKSEVWTTTHCLGLGHETMVCAVCLFSYEFVIWLDCFVGHLCPGGICPESGPLSLTCRITTLLGTLLMIDTLAYIFSLVYFSVEVCLVGVFPHSVSTWRDPCVRVYVPLTWLHPPPPHDKSKSKGWPGSLLEPSEGAFELTHGSACIDGWKSGLLDILIYPYIAQFMGCVISKIHYGLKVVSCFRHFTASHYHHDTRLLTGVEHM